MLAAGGRFGVSDFFSHQGRPRLGALGAAHPQTQPLVCPWVRFVVVVGFVLISPGI